MYFQFLELRHKIEIYNLTGRVAECRLDEMNRPRASVDPQLRVPPAKEEIEQLFAGWRGELATCRKFAPVARNCAAAYSQAGAQARETVAWICTRAPLAPRVRGTHRGCTMAERSFRVNLHNESTMTLVHSADHLCHGSWTDGWNPPPAQIAPGETAGWQSESDGWFRGVEGYAIYNVERADGNQGQLEVYWDNPYFGYTHFGFPFSAGIVDPMCDYDSPSGGSTFGSDSSNLSFRVEAVSFGYTEAGGEVTMPGDMLTAFVEGPGPGLATLFGFLGIKKDPILDLRVADTEPSFIDLGPTSLREFTDATPKDWVGDWRSERVTVQISRAGYNKLSATIRDKTADPELDFSEEFSVGPDGLAHRLQDVPLTHLVGAGAAAGDEETSILFTRAARDVLHSGANADSGKPWMALRFASAVSARAQDSAIPEPPAGLTIRLGQALAGVVSSSRSHVRLSHSVGLTLYQVIQDGSVIGQQVGYLRLVAFQPAAEEQLVEHYQIT